MLVRPSPIGGSLVHVLVHLSEGAAENIHDGTDPIYLEATKVKRHVGLLGGMRGVWLRPFWRVLAMGSAIFRRMRINSFRTTIGVIVSV